MSLITLFEMVRLANDRVYVEALLVEPVNLARLVGEYNYSYYYYSFINIL